MFHFQRKPAASEFYDRETLRPVIRSSICTGEQTAGFQNLETGKFTEVQLIRSSQDLHSFMERYGIREVPETIY